MDMKLCLPYFIRTWEHVGLANLHYKYKSLVSFGAECYFYLEYSDITGGEEVG